MAIIVDLHLKLFIFSIITILTLSWHFCYKFFRYWNSLDPLFKAEQIRQTMGKQTWDWSSFNCNKINEYLFIFGISAIFLIFLYFIYNVLKLLTRKANIEIREMLFNSIINQIRYLIWSHIISLTWFCCSLQKKGNLPYKNKLLGL